MLPCLFVCVNWSAHVNEYICKCHGGMWCYTFIWRCIHERWLKLISFANETADQHIPQLLHSAKAVPRTRFLQPDAEIRSDNLEWAFRGSHKWMCGEGGEITLTRNHLIMATISCHWYQSSFYVVGWIYARMLCSGGVGGDAALACDCSVFWLTNTSNLTFAPKDHPSMNDWKAAAAFSPQSTKK